MRHQTIMTGIIGFPIEHSISAVMQNAAFQSLRLNYQYLAFSVPPTDLKDAVNGIKALGFKGVNITIPHKVAVMELLDEVDESARDIGAVNTILNDNGRLIGFNTDGAGYIQSLKEELNVHVSGLHVLLLGAGGAARSISTELARAEIGRIHIFDQRTDCSRSLAKHLSSRVEAEAVSSDEMAKMDLSDIQLVINTTPVGMYPKVNDIPLSPALLHPGLIVSDIVYNPYETMLIKEAKKIGAKVHHGAGMLVHQGALSFHIWTGHQAPVDVMRTAAINELKQDSLMK